MRARLKAVVAAVAAVLLVAGCTDAASPPEVRAPSNSVDVDTAALRAQKAEAGIEPCRAPSGASQGAADAAARLPEVTLPCLGGGPEVDLSRLRGPLVVNLFAQWCGPCREELPYYQQLHQKAGDRLRVLGIDYLDTQPGGALDLAQATGVTYPLLADPQGLLRSELRVRGLPGVVFVDESGRVTAVEFTVVRSYKELADLVEQHLGVRI